MWENCDRTMGKVARGRSFKQQGCMDKEIANKDPGDHAERSSMEDRQVRVFRQ